MLKVHIPATSSTPDIVLDGNRGSFSFKGKSYPYDALSHYQDVLDYIEDYSIQAMPTTELAFEWLYYNSSTSKVIVQILLMLRTIETDLKVTWTCQKGADLMIEKAQEYSRLLHLNIEIKTI